MLTKQFGALNIFILAVLLASSILVGLAVLYFLDRALLARTVSQRGASGASGAPAREAPNSGGTVLYEVLQGSNDNPLGSEQDFNSLRNSDIDPATAKAALRNAPGKTIQNAVRAKTGKTVSVDKIERARKKALSSDGQQKINEALKRRDEVDLTTIRNKLGQ